MFSKITGPYLADDLFTLEETPLEGHVPFANQTAKRKSGVKGNPDLAGPGIYGVFCKGKLYYVGIYTGHNKKTFAGSALDRWDMHLTYFSLRSPRITFIPSTMKKILGMPGPLSDEFARVLKGRDLSVDQIRSSSAPFIVGKQASCTANKAKFATNNWDVFRPGNELAMLKDVSFVYGRILPTAEIHLGDAQEHERYWWAKYQWLQARETRLVKDLKPVCNAVTKLPRLDVGIDAFTEALKVQLNAPLSLFDAETMQGKYRKIRARAPKMVDATIDITNSF